MFDFVFGLPMHALVIHAVVVFVPLSVLCTVAYVVRPSWRWVLRWPTVAGALISGVSAFVAAESGEQLLARVSTTRASTTNFELLSNHTTWGDRAKLVCLVFMVVALVGVYLMPPPVGTRPATVSASVSGAGAGAARERATATTTATRATTWTTTTAVQTALRAVVAAVSLAALVVVVITGHSGSQVVWAGLG